ncbi:tyrosine-type recombinase/integrase [Rossellomorea sp. SC111]|uniref:tyrosine-type recombinase/integrase n=1 Tax=Rossellomorea sp. SC111 TaxID=2968985 RepID=UPI00215B7358|nr:tyrosine-type recombinase/integrase [Rossellomorea sp. SC111]MCR8847767.1 tyrosine-type recombinase/integrase [Rossellomorea sp. SC111]
MDFEVQTAFFNDYKTRFSPATIHSYTITLQQLFTFCNKSFDEVKATDIRSWLAAMEDEGLKQRTIHTKLAGVKSFYRYCIEENKVIKDPTLTIQSPQIDDSLPYYLSKRQLVLLQELTRGNLRDRAIVETLYATGVRISELLQIATEDVKWETRQIWIRKGKGNKERFVLFTHECTERIKLYHLNRGIKSEFLFSNSRGGKLSRQFVQQRFREFSTTLGFKVSPHTLRHTFAAHLAEKNMPQLYIQELLGHVNINSTRMYTRLMETARKKQYDRFQT